MGTEQMWVHFEHIPCSLNPCDSPLKLRNQIGTALVILTHSLYTGSKSLWI